MTKFKEEFMFKNKAGRKGFGLVLIAAAHLVSRGGRGRAGGSETSRR